MCKHLCRATKLIHNGCSHFCMLHFADWKDSKDPGRKKEEDESEGEKLQDYKVTVNVGRGGGGISEGAVTYRVFVLHTATWLVNRSCFPDSRPMNRAMFLSGGRRVTMKCWAGNFQVPLSGTFGESITDSRKFLPPISVLFFSVVGDECVVTFHPHMSKWPEDGRGAAEFSQLTQITLFSSGKQNTAELTSCFLLQESVESHLEWFPAARLVSLESLSVTQKSITAPKDIPTFSRN